MTSFQSSSSSPQSNTPPSPFLQFKLTSKRSGANNNVFQQPPSSRVEKSQHNMKYNASPLRGCTPHMFINSTSPPIQQQNQYMPTAPSSGHFNQPQEKKKKISTKRTLPTTTLTPPQSNQQTKLTQPAYIHWKFNESFDNVPKQLTFNSTCNNSKGQKVKYGCLAFSLSDCKMVNNVNYQRPHHNTNNNWLPPPPVQHVNQQHTQNLHVISPSPLESRESNSGSNSYSNQADLLNISPSNTTVKKSMIQIPDTPPNQATSSPLRVIRTNISIKDILN